MALDLCKLRTFLAEPDYRRSVTNRVGDSAVLGFFRTVFDALDGG